MGQFELKQKASARKLFVLRTRAGEGARGPSKSGYQCPDLNSKLTHHACLLSLAVCCLLFAVCCLLFAVYRLRLLFMLNRAQRLIKPAIHRRHEKLQWRYMTAVENY